MLATTLILLSLVLQGVPDRTASISGQVWMTGGAPAAAVRVAAIPAPRENVRAAEGQNYYATQQPAAVGLTDASGRYRLTVPPGRYIVAAGLAGAATWHPSATDIDSATVLSADASPIQNVDIVMQTFAGALVGGRVVPPPSRGTREYAALAGVGLGEMLEVPVREDGTFEFGRIPRGAYLLNVFPNPSGQQSLPFRVDDRDVLSLELVRPPVRRVSGRISVQNGPLPFALLGFSTLQGHVSATINPDLTFSVGLHSAQHRVDLAGLPVDYEVRSVYVGSTDVTASGITVADRDVNNVTINVGVRRDPPALRGRVSGTSRGATATVELTGPIIGTIRATLSPDGTFAVPALPPGRYRARLAGSSEASAADVVVTSTGGEITLTLGSRP